MRPHRRPLAGRELWRIGDWGAASQQIGQRWEQLGAAHLQDLARLPATPSALFRAEAAISLVESADCQQAIQAAGLPHADAVLVGSIDGHRALRAVDFKWSLEVARVDQISADTLRSLLETELPPVRRALEPYLPGLSEGPAARGEGPLSDGSTELLDGLFLAPGHAANRHFLGSQANLRRDEPLRADQVALVQVGGREFFSALSGWEVGENLAGQEGARRTLETLEGAERYFRLGAGVLGAVTARRRSIFDDTAPTFDPLAELASLRRAHSLRTTEQLIDYLDRLMTARAELTRTLSQLGRRCYPFATFRARLAAVGIKLGDRAEANPEDRRWSRLYGVLQRQLSERIKANGRALVAGGASDAEALAALTERCPALARDADQQLARLIGAERAAS